MLSHKPLHQGTHGGGVAALVTCKLIKQRRSACVGVRDMGDELVGMNTSEQLRQVEDMLHSIG